MPGEMKGDLRKLDLVCTLDLFPICHINILRNMKFNVVNGFAKATMAELHSGFFVSRHRQFVKGGAIRCNGVFIWLSFGRLPSAMNKTQVDYKVTVLTITDIFPYLLLR